MVNICRKTMFTSGYVLHALWNIYSNFKNKTKLTLLHATVHQQVLAVWLESVPLLGFASNIYIC